jgi:peptidoglycan/LPS O-acetylase OafA/YrhL
MNLRPVSGKGVKLSSVHLDAVRGFAALIVLIGHARVLFLSSMTGVPHVHSSITLAAANSKVAVPNLAAGANSIGHEAVMVFFVLSGLLVGGSVLKQMKKNRWSWKDYLLKRMTRLWIVLIPALVLGAILDHAGMHMFSNPHSIYSAPPGQGLVTTNLSRRYSPGILLGNLVFLQNRFVPTAGSNVALWSLTNEFWYYIAFPFLLLGFGGKIAIWKRAICAAAFAGILTGIGANASRLFLVWMLGAVVSALPLKIPQPIAKWGTVLFGIILSAAICWVKRNIVNIVAAEFSIALICACLLYLMLHQTQDARNGIYSLVSTFTSKTSYTLYLVHVPILIFLCACINNPWHIWPRTPAHVAIMLSACRLTVALAFGFYLLFEANTDHLRNFITRKITRA